MNLDLLNQHKDKDCRYKGIAPMPVCGWIQYISFWINVFPNMKIQPKGRNIRSEYLTYANAFRYMKIMDKKYGTKNNTEK